MKEEVTVPGSPTSNAASASALDLAAIYEAEVAYVWQVLRRLGVGPADLEDLCQDVFIAFWRTRLSYDPSRPLRPWLFGIAFRLVSDERRRARHRHEVPADDRDVRDESRPVDEQMGAAEDRRLVMEALEHLDLDQRAVFVLHDIEERSMPEIALVLDAPLNTLYSRLRLGRGKFAAAVRRRRGDHEGS